MFDLFIFNTVPIIRIIYGYRQINRPMIKWTISLFQGLRTTLHKDASKREGIQLSGVRICESMSLLSNWPHLEQMMMMIRLHHYGLCCRRGSWQWSAAWKHRTDSRHDINTIPQQIARYSVVVTSRGHILLFMEEYIMFTGKGQPAYLNNHVHLQKLNSIDI